MTDTLNPRIARRSVISPQRTRTFILTLISTVAIVGCASTPSAAEESDPLKGYNRAMFAFNEGVDEAIIGPAAKGYEFVTPKFFRDGVGNALTNLNAPVVLANDILQLKPGRAAETTGRFFVNSTVGVAGVWDAATYFGMPEGHEEDFGQTLGHWGVPEGPYVVLPLLGPSTVRDAPSIFVDTFFDPLTHVDLGGDPDIASTIQYTSAGLGALNARVEFDEQIKLLRSQPEPYTALRRGYLGSRRAAIRDGEMEGEQNFDDLPDFDDYLSYDEEITDGAEETVD